jgi:putative membrane protein
MKRIYLFLKGILIGIALVLPGLSGSLMAVLLGMYGEIVGWMASVRNNIRNLLVLGAGAVIGILISAKIVLVLCIAYPGPCNWFFLGLVAGGIPMLIQNVRGRHFTRFGFLPLLLGGAVILSMALCSGNAADFHIAISRVSGLQDAGILLAAGFISCGLMMFPGVSGSVLLILLGQYGTVYGAVSDITNFSRWSEILPICILFAIGGILGVLIISKLMKWAMERFPRMIQWLILGLTSGTCASLALVCVGNEAPGFSWVYLLFLGLGFGATVLTGRIERKNKA